MNLYWILDEAYSSIGSAMGQVDDVPAEKQKAVEAKVLEIKRLTEELEELLKDTP